MKKRNNTPLIIIFGIAGIMILIGMFLPIFTKLSLEKEIAQEKQRIEEAEFRGSAEQLEEDLKHDKKNMMYQDSLTGSNSTVLKQAEDSGEYIYIIKEHTYYKKETSSKKRYKNNTDRRKNIKKSIHTTSMSLEIDEFVYFEADKIMFGNIEIDLDNLSTIDMVKIYEEETGSYEKENLDRIVYYGIKANNTFTILTDIEENTLKNIEFYSASRTPLKAENAISVKEQEIEIQQNEDLISELETFENADYITIGDLTYTNIDTLNELLKDGWKFSYDMGIETKNEFDKKLNEYKREKENGFSSSIDLYRNDDYIFVNILYTDENNLQQAKVTSITLYPNYWLNSDTNYITEYITAQGYTNKTNVSILEATYKQKNGTKKTETYGTYYIFNDENMKTSFSVDDKNVSYVVIEF